MTRMRDRRGVSRFSVAETEGKRPRLDGSVVLKWILKKRSDTG